MFQARTHGACMRARAYPKTRNYHKTICHTPEMKWQANSWINFLFRFVRRALVALAVVFFWSTAKWSHSLAVIAEVGQIVVQLESKEKSHIHSHEMEMNLSTLFTHTADAISLFVQLMGKETYFAQIRNDFFARFQTAVSFRTVFFPLRFKTLTSTYRLTTIFVPWNPFLIAFWFPTYNIQSYSPFLGRRWEDKRRRLTDKMPFVYKKKKL